MYRQISQIFDPSQKYYQKVRFIHLYQEVIFVKFMAILFLNACKFMTILYLLHVSRNPRNFFCLNFYLRCPNGCDVIAQQNLRYNITLERTFIASMNNIMDYPYIT